MGNGVSQNFVEDGNNPSPHVIEGDINVSLPNVKNSQKPINQTPISSIQSNEQSMTSQQLQSQLSVNTVLEASSSPSFKNSKASSKEGKYEGDRNELNEKDGLGKMIYGNGDTYVGEWKNNKKDGKGTYLYKNGDCYTGEFLKGNKHGKGDYRYTSGDYYTGFFINGKKNGIGTYNFQNGSQYIGDFSNDSQHGQGTYRYASGAVYVGGWKKGEVHGLGKYQYPSGNNY